MDKKTNIHIHSLVQLKHISIAYPFIIKAYKAGVAIGDINELCKVLEKLSFRDRVIGTKADLRSRIRDVYESFDGLNVNTLVDRVNWMREEGGYWWGHWNDGKLFEAVSWKLNHSIAKYILWRYENYLNGLGHSGYAPVRYDAIDRPEMEHIAPTTKPDCVKTGYGSYNEKFINESIECVGNYLLLSKSHNCSVGNIRFEEKLKTYTHSMQQREVVTFLEGNMKWDATAISKRKDKIVEFIMSYL